MTHDVIEQGGSNAGKKAADGHKTDAMVDVYDFEIPEVTTPGGV